MDAKDLLRSITQPARKAFRTFRNRPLRYWNGAYSSYRAAPSMGGGFDSTKYVEIEVASTASAIEAARTERHKPKGIQTTLTLPVLASTVARANDGRLRVLDFGGGIGNTYLDILGAAVACTDLQYHVIELEWACREGPRLFEGDSRIHFHRALPPGLRDIDIVYASGVLMYVEDYPALLRSLCAYRPGHVFVETLAAGPFPTFASTQLNIGPGPVPHWFFNLDEFVGLVENEGYTLVFRNPDDLAGAHDNFDAKYRLDEARYWSLLFERRDPAPASA